MVTERENYGPYLLKDLTVNDSWIGKAYIEVAKAKRKIINTKINGHTIVGHAVDLQRAILDHLPGDASSGRQIDSEKVECLSELVQSSQGGLIIMRHGIQFVEDEDRKRLIDPTKKIRLMQLPYNLNDPAAAQSLAEAGSLALVLMYLGLKNEIPVVTKTSGNKRAAEIGAIIAVVNGFDVAIDSRLTCANYPTDKSDEELARLLGRENNGSLAWNRDIVDSVCGEGKFDSITNDITHLIDELHDKPQLTVCITHTPQTNAADLIAGKEPMRMPELGFRLFTKNTSILFPDNIFRAENNNLNGLF